MHDVSNIQKPRDRFYSEDEIKISYSRKFDNQTKNNYIEGQKNTNIYPKTTKNIERNQSDHNLL